MKPFDFTPIAIESPYAAGPSGDIQFNVALARALCRAALLQGYAPYLSHLIYPQPGILKDHDPHERMLGINAGLAIASTFAVRGIASPRCCPIPSKGMILGREHAEKIGQQIVEIDPDPDWFVSSDLQASRAYLAWRRVYPTRRRLDLNMRAAFWAGVRYAGGEDISGVEP